MEHIIGDCIIIINFYFGISVLNMQYFTEHEARHNSFFKEFSV